MNQFVSNYEEACKRLNRSEEIPDVSKWPEKQQRREIAAWKLDAILEVNNAGWKADLGDTTQYKWHPIYRVKKDKGAPAGFRLAFYDSFYAYDCDYLGVRHACKDRELSDFMGMNCAELYTDLRS